MNSLKNQKICLRGFIPRKVSNKPINISEEELKSLYWDKKLSSTQIAEIYNCNAETIRRYMIRFEIERREFHGRKYKISKEDLEKLYINEKLSTIEIAKKYGCSPWVISSLLKWYNIIIRHANDYHQWKSPINQIKPNLDESPNLAYVVSVILGDGWTYKRGHCYFIGLETSDKIFCENFRSVLIQLGLNPSLFKNKRNYWKVVCSSKLFYIWFNSLSFQQIKDISKKYPIDFIRGFYESEGSLSIYKSKKYYYTTHTIIIVNTNQDLILLAKYLLENLGFHPVIHKRNPPRAHWKPLWALTLGRKLEVQQFLTLIKPCIKTGEKRRDRNI